MNDYFIPGLSNHVCSDHFDEKVESMLRRDLPIITTPHAHSHLTSKGDESFTSVHALDFWESMTLTFDTGRQLPTRPRMQITGMPGTHVPPGPLAMANDILKAVPPTNGWMLELGYTTTAPSSKPTTSESGATPVPDTTFQPGYRIYISGDTLMFDDLHRIPELYSSHTGKPIDLMLIHLGGTTIPSPKIPLVMVTMDAKMGLELVQIIGADVTIPIHYDDYDVFVSPLSDFQKAMDAAGLSSKVVYLDRGEEYRFTVKKSV